MSEHQHIDVCILMDIEPGFLTKTVERLNELSEVGLVTPVSGVSDILAIVRVNNPSELTEFIVSKIHVIDGILKTNTMLCLEPLQQRHWFIK